MHITLKKFIVFLSIVILTACGGGGGGASEPTPPPTPPATVNITANPISVAIGAETTLTWTTTNASTCNASGAWSGTKSTAGSEAVSIAASGDNQFNLTCSGPGGTGSDSAIVEGYETASGFVVDGYISGAEVFIDQNSNLLLDGDETSTVSSSNGEFSLRKFEGDYISIGGIDYDTQATLDGLLLWHKNFENFDPRAITPVTSVASFLEAPLQINSMLGFDQNINIFTFDPVASLSDSSSDNSIYEIGNQFTIIALSILNSFNEITGASDTTDFIFQAISEELQIRYDQTGEQVNIETTNFVDDVVDNAILTKTIVIDEANRSNLVTAITALMPIIQVKQNSEGTNAIFNFSLTTFIQDVKEIATGQASQEKITKYTEDILEYISEDQNIAQSEIAPEIFANEDLVFTNEDESISFNVLLNDSFLTNSPIEVSYGNVSDGLIEISGGDVVYTPNANYNGTDSLAYVISQGGLSAENVATITVNPVADAPVFTSPSTFAVPENQLDVTTLTASDADGDEITFSKQGQDSDSFNLEQTTGVLTFSEAPDYETKTDYTLIAQANDGANITEKELFVAVTNVNEFAPEFDVSLEFNVPENQNAIGRLSATDADGDEVSVSISSDEVVIDSSNFLTFINQPDYESKSSYTFNATASDGEKQTTKVVTVNITNLNDNAPVIESETFNVAENLESIGAIVATDADGDSLNFSITGNEILIDSATGAMIFAQQTDYESKQSYTATVLATDGVFTTLQNITINLINTNDNPPKITSSATFSANENQTSIGTVVAEDADVDVVTFSVSGSNLAVDTDSGALSFISAPDYESNTSFTGTVTATDGEFVSTQNITVNVLNLNDNPPIFTSSSTISKNEGQVVIGTATASDADGDSLIFSTDSENIRISSAGIMSFINVPDYETKDSYSETIIVNDGAFTTTQDLTITILDIDEVLPQNNTDFNTYELTDTFSEYTSESENLSPWIANVNVYDASGNFDSGYTFAPPSNGPQVSQILTDQDASNRFLNFYSNYDDADHAFLIIQTALYREFTITEDLIGYFRTAADGKLPLSDACGSINSDNGADGGECGLFIKVLNPQNGNAAELQNTSNVPVTNDWQRFYVDAEILPSYQGMLLQIGFVNQATNYAPTAVHYDNFTLTKNTKPILSTTSFTIDENQTVIGSIGASDADGHSLTYSTTSEEIAVNNSGELSFIVAPNYEAKSLYTAAISVTDSYETTTETITININDVNEGTTDTATACDVYISNAKSDEFRYCWQESQDNSGEEYSANVNEPISVTFDGSAINIPEISFAELLYSDYGIILSNENVTWTNDYAYALYESIKKTPLAVRGEGADSRSFSTWTITTDFITDDISLSAVSDGLNVIIGEAAFVNANPKIAEVEGKRGIFFSNRLFKSVVRFISNNGTNQSIVEQMLSDRYGVSINVDDYLALTGEESTRFQDFQPEELVEIIAMFEEMPSGYHKVEGLNYLVRRLNGGVNPFYPEAPAIAWVGSGYVEFMESGFNSTTEEYIHRLILHEKAHFMWGDTHDQSTGGNGIFDATLKADWIELGGWYECTERESGWCTTKQTEFVSAYAHSKNPNEDMAESLSFFVINPDALRSRSLAKYEFIRDRIMQGNIYISQIRDDLTFEVYNLYPDYVFPGKIKKLQVSLKGSANDDKTLVVEVELHALDNVLEGAATGYMRVFSSIGTFFDFYLYPTDGSSSSTRLRSTPISFSKFSKDGFWKVNNITLTDSVGNIRNLGANDFGWRLHVNSPLEDVTDPEYVQDSINLYKTSEVLQNQTVDVLNVTWSINETNPRENQGCYGRVNDEVLSTYSLEQYSPQTYGAADAYTPSQCYLKYFIPYYMPSGSYSISYAKIFDLPGNSGEVYFQPPSGSVNAGWENPDDVSPSVTIETTNPDVIAPELDLNDIGVSAVPTNPSAPNGETIVTFRFKVKDNISGYQIGSFLLRDPQGSTFQYYHYPPRRSDIFPTSEDLDWKEYEATVVLPPGSAPGTWGVAEMTLRDRAQNFKTYNFTEIVSFVVDN